ncbi:hypothetical protein HMPREF0281_00244 [Corynebacterium ammoniagenes DSM 20306]|uniref:Uncharacterized protein n=1 Tax=Corynebacterium ammoniagenes DSM 20306 TaxID=649754 RepID=A0ABN0AIH3_CORAM|nr:hypothetical protein HMPREF0281_00244 [Corynebacterium ammoniagenes DSM 20306]
MVLLEYVIYIGGYKRFSFNLAQIGKFVPSARCAGISGHHRRNAMKNPPPLHSLWRRWIALNCVTVPL